MTGELPWQTGTTLRDGNGAPASPSTPGPVADRGEYRSTLDAAVTMLDRVDRALRQLADGSYGRCSECGQTIDPDVLEADPTQQWCRAHMAGPVHPE
jgi:hypothetical protein